MRSDPIEVQVKKNHHRAIRLAIAEDCGRTPHAGEMPGFCSRPWLSQIVAEMRKDLSGISVRSYVVY